MITFLITPVKSRRDSFLFETPTQKLTFDVAETPALFDSLHHLKQLQSSRRKSCCVLDSAVQRPRPLSQYTPRRKSLCILESPSFSARYYKQQIQQQPPPPHNRQQPLSPLLDFTPNESQIDPLELLPFGNDQLTLTPANLFNATINKISNNYQIQQNDDVNNDTNDIIASTQHNNEFYITMLISNRSPPQQKIHQYLIENNNNLNPRGINVIETCCCISCQRRNWNLVDIRWEKQWQIQQFQFVLCQYTKQLYETKCEYISDILVSNGILQSNQYMEAQKTLQRKKRLKTATSRNQSARKKRAKTVIVDNVKQNKNKDKKIMLQHLATWSQSVSTSEIDTESIEYSTVSTQLDIEYLPLLKKEGGCLYISAETLRDLMDGSMECDLFDYFVIIDCRYEYEYLGGHISGAINVSDKLLMELLFKANINIKNIKSQRIAWIFHCEYSKHRGPETCKYFRKLDREENENRYPYVSYPHVYVLNGGYKKFWNKYKNSYWTLKDNLFQPYGYISMWNDLYDDKRFTYSQFRKNVWRKTSKKHKTKLSHMHR